jgi:predicted deacylase
MARCIAEEILPNTDYLIDFHLGIWGSTMGSVILGVDYSDPDMNRKSFDLGLAFGSSLILATRMVTHWPGPRSSLTYAGEVLGIPSCSSMIGGAGFDRDLEDLWSEANYRGVQNIMAHLDMVEGDLQLPDQYLVFESVQRVNPRFGGLLIPENEVETFARVVREGELLGRVVSPFTFDTLEELRSPMNGYLAYWSRSYPLRPGDWAYGVIPQDHSGTRWMERPSW